MGDRAGRSWSHSGELSTRARESVVRLYVSRFSTKYREMYTVGGSGPNTDVLVVVVLIKVWSPPPPPPQPSPSTNLVDCTGSAKSLIHVYIIFVEHYKWQLRIGVQVYIPGNHGCGTVVDCTRVRAVKCRLHAEGLRSALSQLCHVYVVKFAVELACVNDSLNLYRYP